MKKVLIKDEARVAIGFAIIFMVITCTIIFAVYNSFNISTLLLVSIVFICGTLSILNGIETKAQRQKRKEELQEMAKMYGWDKNGDME